MARSAQPARLYGVYYVQGFERETALDYAGVEVGNAFPDLTNGDNLDGKYQEDFFGFWMSPPWDAYLLRASAEKPALRVLFIEYSKTLPFGRKVPKQPMPEWIDDAIAWGKSTIDGVDLGIDVLEPVATSRLHQLLFADRVPALEGFRARLNSNGLFSSFEDAAEFIAAAHETPLRPKPQAMWSAHRVFWLRSLPNVTVPLWAPPASP